MITVETIEQPFSSSFWTAMGVLNLAKQTALLNCGLTAALAGETRVMDSRLYDINEALKELVNKRPVLEQLVIEAIQDPANVSFIREELTEENKTRFDQLYSQYCTKVKLEIKKELAREAELRKKSLQDI